MAERPDLDVIRKRWHIVPGSRGLDGSPVRDIAALCDEVDRLAAELAGARAAGLRVMACEEAYCGDLCADCGAALETLARLGGGA